MTLPKPLVRMAKRAANRYSKPIYVKGIGKCYDLSHLGFMQGFIAGYMKAKKTRKRRRK